MKSLEQEYLEHSGVKGMKWGVRRAQKKDQKWESKKKYEKEFDSIYAKTHNSSVELGNKGLNSLNKKYKDINFNDPKNSEISKKYWKEADAIYVKAFNQTLDHNKSLISPSGKKKARLYLSEKGIGLKVVGD